MTLPNSGGDTPPRPAGSRGAPFRRELDSVMLDEALGRAPSAHAEADATTI